jgi:uncharacterized protein YukE
MGDGITKDEMKDLLTEQAKIIRGGNSSGGGAASPKGTGEFAESLDNIKTKFNPLGTALDGMGAAVSGVKSAYANLEGVIKPGMQTWQKLSETGASFSNDIVGMSAAAAGTRMNLDEFATVIKNNAGNFNGLGGNAAKGAENFAKLSKEMQDSGASDSLRQLGMTTADINETLALQLGMQQTVNM